MKKFDVKVWERILNDLPSSYRKWFNDEVAYLRKNITKNSKVLEVGCGDGRSIKDILSVTRDITGIDHDKKAVDDAKNNFRHYPKIKIIKAEATKLPFKKKTFDFVLCMTTFANFGKKKYKVLDEMKRVLKDDGFIIISAYSDKAFKERMKLYKKIKFPIKKIIGTTVIYYGEFDDGISEQFSKKELENLFSKAKLEIIDIKKLNMAHICKLKK